MNHNDSCGDVQKKLALLDYDEPIPQDLQKHLESCPSCRKEYENQKKMQDLLKAASPSVPKLSESVMRRIHDEKIEIKETDYTTKRLRLPLGTIAAAVAVLAVYLSVYAGVPRILFSGENHSVDDSKSVEENETQMFFASGKSVSDDTADSLDTEDSDGQNTYSKALDNSENAEFYVADPKDLSDEEISLPDDFLMPRKSMIASPNTDGTDLNPEATEEGAENGTDSMSPQSYGTAGAENSRSNGLSDAEEPSGEAVTSDSNGGDRGDEKEAEYFAGGVAGSGAGGGNTGANTNEIDFVSLAERQFEKLSEQYPNHISRELFESVGAETYLAFLSSVEDFDADYTAEKLEAFAQQNEKD